MTSDGKPSVSVVSQHMRPPRVPSLRGAYWEAFATSSALPDRCTTFCMRYQGPEQRARLTAPKTPTAHNTAGLSVPSRADATPDKSNRLWALLELGSPAPS